MSKGPDAVAGAWTPRTCSCRCGATASVWTLIRPRCRCVRATTVQPRREAATSANAGADPRTAELQPRGAAGFGHPARGSRIARLAAGARPQAPTRPARPLPEKWPAAQLTSVRSSTRLAGRWHRHRAARRVA
ncbi:hypothetical protein BDA96_06G072000 [Sorghum bicolor]|uniref:Uncharacterized protein n=1 Tax=Sorghum bicolor TaxID=4558 RepID=A0A921QR68_SORBI|nr:hypothetical protein BDA96_06G072000 [Sorghum bicolor]